MARTILTNDDLAAIEKEYGIVANSVLAKKWKIGVPRLKTEMEKFYARAKIEQTRRRSIAKTRVSAEEVQEIIEQYTVQNLSLSAIAKIILRSPTTVRNVLTRNNIPIRSTSKKTSSTLKFSGDTKSEIVLGDRVYSHYYNAYALVDKIAKDAYRIWVIDDSSENSGGFFAYQSRKQLSFIRRASA